VNVFDVQVLKAYCPECKKIIDGEHECPNKWIVLTDEVLTAIVDRLYNLGLEPVMGMFGFTMTENKAQTLKMSFILSKKFTFEILGPLPAGWEYCWNNGRLYSLEFNDSKSYFENGEAEARLSEVIKEFENFLAEKDPEAIEILTLLTEW